MSANYRSRAVAFDEKKIDAIFAELNQCHLPGAVVGIAIDGRPVYRKGFGLASMELPVVLTPSMRMRLGSTSKHFMAFAYMLLCEEGLAGLDEPVGKYLPELHPVTHEVTMRQLMGNISGLREAFDLLMQFSGTEGRLVTTSDLLSFYRTVDDRNAAPGVTYIYNNGGWVILGAVIECIAQQTLEQVLRERVFEPIGMYNTTFRRLGFTFVPNSPSSHMLNGEGCYVRKEITSRVDCSGATGVVSTVDDMLLWLANMEQPRVGSAKTWETMKTPQTLANGAPTGYGLGLETVSYRGVQTLQHSGGEWGSNAQMLKVPSAGLDVIVMVNRSDRSSMSLVDMILDACLENLDPTTKHPYKGPFFSGLFRSPKTRRVVRLFRDNPSYYQHAEPEVQLAAIDGLQLPVEPDKQGVLRTVDIAARFDISMTLHGNPQSPASIQFSEQGNIDELIPVKPATENDASAIMGHYRSESTSTEAVISATNGTLQVHTIGRFGTAVHTLESLGDCVWGSRPQDKQVAPPWGLLLFDSDKSAFGFSDFFNRDLRFRRVS